MWHAAAMRCSLRRRAATVCTMTFIALTSMPLSASDLHPISAPLPAAEIRFQLRGGVRAGSVTVVQSTYRARREGDVKKERHMHLFDSPWRSGSRDLLSVHREESHVVRQDVRVVDGGVAFALPLRDPDSAYRNYQLASVRVDDFEFARWFAETPALDPGFGLECTADSLRGVARSGGLGAEPLRGALPLWPGLRHVALQFAQEEVPVVRLWDPMEKHHWDGWRRAVPQAWPGGRTILARHIASPTVWRAHEYFATPPAGEPVVARPVPPAGVLPGVALEVFWAEGGALEFPEVRFDRPVSVIALRVEGLGARAKALLAERARRRPGVEPGSLTTAEWDELEALAAPANDEPVELKMQRTAQGKEQLVVHRRKLDESWLYLFGTEYDSDRRRALTSLVLHPQRWAGPLPE